MSTLADILPLIWHKLKPRPISSKSHRKLQNELAKRERRIDRLERVGLGKHAAENLYNRPRKISNE